MFEAKDRYVFIVDTSDYAGNFEREMVGFMSGQTGECGVGQVAASVFKSECPDKDFEDIVDRWVMDEHGCGRPASIWLSPQKGRKKRKYNSVAMFLHEKPSEEDVLFWSERAKDFLVRIRTKWNKLSRFSGRKGSSADFLGARLILVRQVEDELMKVS